MPNEKKVVSDYLKQLKHKHRQEEFLLQLLQAEIPDAINYSNYKFNAKGTHLLINGITTLREPVVDPNDPHGLAIPLATVAEKVINWKAIDQVNKSLKGDK